MGAQTGDLEVLHAGPAFTPEQLHVAHGDPDVVENARINSGSIPKPRPGPGPEPPRARLCVWRRTMASRHWVFR